MSYVCRNQKSEKIVHIPEKLIASINASSKIFFLWRNGRKSTTNRNIMFHLEIFMWSQNSMWNWSLYATLLDSPNFNMVDVA